LEGRPQYDGFGHWNGPYRQIVNRDDDAHDSSRESHEAPEKNLVARALRVSVLSFRGSGHPAAALIRRTRPMTIARSTAFNMSHSVSAATVTAARASISTPVRPTVPTRAVMR
jgi:hypothetical protein